MLWLNSIGLGGWVKRYLGGDGRFDCVWLEGSITSPRPESILNERAKPAFTGLTQIISSNTIVRKVQAFVREYGTKQINRFVHSQELSPALDG